VSGQCHAPTSLLLGKSPSTQCIGGCVGHGTSMDGCRKYCPHQHSTTWKWWK